MSEAVDIDSAGVYFCSVEQFGGNRAKRWTPLLSELATLCQRDGIDALQLRARALIVDLATRQIDFRKAIIPHGLINLLAGDAPLKRPPHRPPMSVDDRVEKFVRAARKADGREGRERGAWFPRTALTRFGIRNPRAVEFIWVSCQS